MLILISDYLYISENIYNFFLYYVTKIEKNLQIIMTTITNIAILIIIGINKKDVISLKSNYIFVYILLFVTLISLSACTDSNEIIAGPDKTVDEFFKASQDFDLDKMSSFIYDNTAISSLTAQNESWFLYFKEMMKLMSYEIIKSDIIEDIANVTVKCNIADGKAMIQKVVMEYYTEAYKRIEEGGRPTSEEANLLLESIMKKYMAEYTEPSMIERNVTIELINTDKGWLIKEMNAPLGNVLTANFIDAMYELRASLEEIMVKIKSIDNK